MADDHMREGDMTSFYTSLLLLLFTRLYPQVNSFVSLSDLKSESIVHEELKSYDYYFLGETHDEDSLEAIQSKVISLIRGNATNFHYFFELPVDFNFALEKIFVEDDTSMYTFNSFRVNKETMKLLKDLKTQNIKSINSIDYIEKESFSENDILDYYFNKNVNNRQVNKDLQLVKKINKTNFLFLNFYVHRFNKYKKAYERNILYHYEIIKKDTANVNLVINGIESYINAMTENEIEPFKTKSRECFILNSIIHFLKPEEKLISFNGHLHVPISTQNEWVDVKNWESLVAKMVKKYPKKKVCSIYLLKRTSDLVSEKYFPNEKKYILANTKPGNIYFIKVADDTNLQELKDKFQYMIVW